MVWQSANQDGQFYGIFAQRFDSAGAKIGVELQLNTYTTGTQSQPAVAMNDGGGFVVVWRSGSSQDGSDYGVFGRRFASSGAAQGVEFQVNGSTAGPQVFPAVAIDDQGDFVVVWQATDGYGGATGIFGRRFSSAGAPLAVEFQVGQRTTLQQIRPSIDLASGGAFLVTWTDSARDGSDYGVFARRFDSSGAAVTDDFQVNSYTLFEQRLPAVHLGDNAGYIVVGRARTTASGSASSARRRSPRSTSTATAR